MYGEICTVLRLRGPKALSRSPTLPPRSEQGLLFPSVRVKGRTGLPLRPRQLYQRTGKRLEAQEHLATATTMYCEMDMRFWLEQAKAEMGGLA
jgi:hypothetical protein